MAVSLVATVASLVLVSGMAPAYADDGVEPATTELAATEETPAAEETAPAEPEATATTPPAETPPAVEATKDDAPAAETEESGTPAPLTSSDEQSKEPTATRQAGSPTTLAQALEVLPLAVTVECVGGPDEVIGVFEIDGNTCAQGNLDWDTTGASVNDGFADSTGFTQGDAENTHPLTWHGGHMPNAKNDIGTAWAHSQVTDDGVFAYFGLTNTSTSGGTGKYDLEYNQLDNVTNANGVLVPDRTPGDLLFQFSGNGSDPVSFDDAKRYTLASDTDWGADCFTVQGTAPAAGWCDIPTPASAFASQTNSTGTFIEGAINLTVLFGAGGDCSGTFGATQVRSITGNSFETASLKDYVAPLGVTTPSTCSTIVIKKFAEGTSTLLSGAEFDVYEGTGTGGTLLHDNIKDGDAADGDAVEGQITLEDIEPGTYTVVEVVAPDGYFLPADPEQTLTVGESSTITFSFEDVKQWQPLTATKTATGSYDVLYDWSIDKGVGGTEAGPFTDSLTKEVADDGDGGTSATFGYEVTVTQGARHVSNIEVAGSIEVANPNDAPVNINLADSLDGAQCTITGGASQTAQPGANSYGYTCTYADGTDPSTLDTGNDATVTWAKDEYPVDADDDDVLDADEATGNHTANASAAVTYTADETNRTVTVTDDKHATWAPDHADPWTVTWTGQGNTDTRTYTRSISAPAGHCTTDVNTARVFGDGVAALDSDSATAKVCVGADLDVSKISKESLTRTYLWDITKSSDDQGGPIFVDPATGEATADFTLTLKATDSSDSAWQMSGDITVANPNAWQDVVITGLEDTYSGGGTCTIDDWAAMTTADRTISADGQKVFGYTCTFTAEPAYDGTNTATVTWDATAASTPTGTDSYDLAVAESDWTLDAEVNKTVEVFDDVLGLGGDAADLPGGPYTWTEGGTWSIDYSVDLTAPAGACQTWTNVGSVVGDQGAVLATDDADVQVCSSMALTVDKTAAGHFDRTYEWSLDKHVSADPSSDTSGWTDADTWTGDDFSHVFGYQVLLSQEGWDDSEFTIDGTITVTNPNQDSQIPAISTTLTDTPAVGAAGTCRVDGGDDDGALLTGYVTDPIASGDDLVIAYECTFANDAEDNGLMYTDGENSVSATNASDSPATAAVTFTQEDSFDETITVYDNKVDLLEPAQLGSATFDETDADKVHTFEYTLGLTADQAACQDFVNTAAGVGDGELPYLFAVATATICPNPGTWTVSKTSDVGDGPVPVDSDITYTLTAHKVGGVNPTDVVVTDDLSDLAPYVDFPVFVAPAGSTVDFDPTTHVLTWTIDELADGADAELDFTVHVQADAYGADLPNLVTSRGSENCPDPQTAAGQDECTTDNDTPHYTLAKSSDAGDTVMPPYLGDPGDTITYTLTVHNDSDAVINGTTMPGAKVVDDLSGVLDNATFVEGSLDPAGQAALSGSTLTWTLPVIAPGQTVTLSYQVTVDADQWDQTLRNTATPAPTGGGVCVEEGGCETTTDTPPATQMQVSKVNAETGDPLAGAGFTLYQDNAPFADPEEPVIGEEDEQIDTATSGADGLAVFTVKLLHGNFLVQETQAPEGYDLPVEGDTMAVVITADNFVANGLMAPFEFRDPAQGQLAIVAKEQFERDPLSGLWVPSDGEVGYGDEVRYVVKVAAEGPKLFHDVTVTDYVPGFNPDDTVSTGRASLVPDTAICTGSLTCTVTVEDGLVTWSAGTVQDAAGAMEMVVRFPELPLNIPFDANDQFTTTLWNVGYLAWDEVVFTDVPQEQVPEATRSARVVETLAHHQLVSNEVIVSATVTQPPTLPPTVTPPAVAPPQGGPTPPGTLPNTGGPEGWLPLTGLGLVLLGAGLLLFRDRRRQRA